MNGTDLKFCLQLQHHVLYCVCVCVNFIHDRHKLPVYWALGHLCSIGMETFLIVYSDIKCFYCLTAIVYPMVFMNFKTASTKQHSSPVTDDTSQCPNIRIPGTPDGQNPIIQTIKFKLPQT